MSLTVSPIAEVRTNLELMSPEFAKVLPPQVTPEKFVRVVMTAIQAMPILLECNRGSLWSACMKAAEQGLLPDGQQGAIIPFKGMCKWIPMVDGVRILARNSGEISKWEVRVIKENDTFSYEQGDDEKIVHKPFLGGGRGKTIGAYSIVTFRDGEKSREVMMQDEIEKVRAKSRAKDGEAWREHYDEMCKKTVARRHFKSLPKSTDQNGVRLEKAITSDDEDFDFSEESKPQTTKKTRLEQVIGADSDASASSPQLADDEKFPFED